MLMIRSTTECGDHQVLRRHVSQLVLVVYTIIDIAIIVDNSTQSTASTCRCPIFERELGVFKKVRTLIKTQALKRNRFRVFEVFGLLLLRFRDRADHNKSSKVEHRATTRRHNRTRPPLPVGSFAGWEVSRGAGA